MKKKLLHIIRQAMNEHHILNIANMVTPLRNYRQ